MKTGWLSLFLLWRLKRKPELSLRANQTSSSLSCLFFISIFKRGWVSTSPCTEIFDFRSVLILFFFFFFFQVTQQTHSTKAGPSISRCRCNNPTISPLPGKKAMTNSKDKTGHTKKRKKKTALQQSLDDSVTRRRLWFQQQWASSTYQTRRKGEKKEVWSHPCQHLEEW